MCRTAAQRNDIPFERVRLAVAGVPGVPDPGSGRILMAPNIPRVDTFDFTSELEDALGMEVHLDNDVNLAVLGENWLGSGQGADHLAFIALGTGIGAGLVLGGRLVRGAGNAAGELGFLPFGGDALDRARKATGSLEESIATDGIRRRYAALSGRSASVPEVFDLAGRGDRHAVAVLDETARHLGRAIVALCAIADPGKVVLGGSIGARPELVDRVRTLLEDVSPMPVSIEASTLGPRAAVAGATAVGLGRLHNTLFGLEEVPDIEMSLPPARVITLKASSQ